METPGNSYINCVLSIYFHQQNCYVFQYIRHRSNQNCGFYTHLCTMMANWILSPPNHHNFVRYLNLIIGWKLIVFHILMNFSHLWNKTICLSCYYYYSLCYVVHFVLTLAWNALNVFVCYALLSSESIMNNFILRWCLCVCKIVLFDEFVYVLFSSWSYVFFFNRNGSIIYTETIKHFNSLRFRLIYKINTNIQLNKKALKSKTIVSYVSLEFHLYIIKSSQKSFN